MSHDRLAVVQPRVGRYMEGWTAETRADTWFVQPPYLVPPPRAHTWGRVRTCARARMRICIQVRQGREVRRTKGWRGFPSVQPSSIFRGDRTMGPRGHGRGSFLQKGRLRVMNTPRVLQSDCTSGGL